MYVINIAPLLCAMSAKVSSGRFKLLIDDVLAPAVS
jgi:hypothetical protein